MNADGSSRFVSNGFLFGPITREMAQAEYQRWKEKVKRNGVIIGPRNQNSMRAVLAVGLWALISYWEGR